MGRDVVKAKLDIIFKKLFTSDNSVLTAFVGDILDLPQGAIKKVDVLNPNIMPVNAEGKQGQLDLKMQVDDKIVNVEIQLRNRGDFRDRALYYWSKIYTDELKKGERYTDLKQTITINILNFNLFDCEEPYSSFSMLETKRNEQLTDKCSILFFELKKVNSKIETNNRKKLWLQLINAETEEELDMLEQTGVPEIQKAVVILHEMSADEELREMARLREKWALDYNSDMSSAEKRGEKKKEAEIFDIMRKIGMSEDQIEKIIKYQQKGTDEK